MTARGLASARAGARQSRLARTAALLAALAAGLASPAAAQEAADLLVKKASRSGDLWLAGYTVDVHGVVDGDVNAVGIQAGLDGSVKGDVNLAGLRVRVGGIVGDDARALGGHVVVQGSVADGLLAAGGQVEVTRNTYVGGTAMIAGGRLRLLGDFHGDLRAAGARVELDGEADRTVTVWSDDVRVGPAARLRGDLVVRGKNPPLVAEGARIEGKVTHEPPPATGLAGWFLAAVRAALLQVGMLAVAGAFLLLTPALGRAASSLRRRGMGLPEAAGAVAVLALPLNLLPVAATLIGIPLAAGMAAAWVLLLLAAWSASAMALGAALRRRLRRDAPPERYGERLAWIYLALLALRAAAAIPVAGWIAVGLAFLLGSAAVGRAVWAGLGAAGGGREGA